MPPEGTNGGFWFALTALIIVVTQILQTLLHRYTDKATAAELKTTTKAEAQKISDKTDATAGKIDSVYQALNGKGLTGKLDEITAWQDEHERNDVKRFAELHEFLHQFSPPDSKKAANDP